jgi:hypothetical protein
VHHTDVVPELAGRKNMSLIARSKKVLTSKLYASQISYGAEEKRASSCGLGVVDKSLNIA